MKINIIPLFVSIALFGAIAMPVQADNTAMQSLLKVLRDKGTITALEYDQIILAAQETPAAVSPAETALPAATTTVATAPAVKITTKGKIKFEGDGWRFQPIGRVMWDAISTDEDSSGTANFGGTELRRARLGFQGKIQNWGYKFEGDFAKGDVAIKDAYLSYGTTLAGNKFGVKLGQSHVPFGLNTKVSSKYMSFMDRPWFADSGISPARESGITASYAAANYRWAVAAGLTNGGIKSGATNNNGSTFALRGSIVPFMQDKTHLLQLGVGFLTKGGGDTFKYKQRLVSHKDASKWLSSTPAENDGATGFTLDALGVYGAFHAMAEYTDYTLKQTTNPDIDFSGFALEAGYFLTGESLKWRKGYTSGIKPKSSTGAWQVAARFETLEIDEFGSRDEADKWTVGLNYYPTQNIRLMLNYDKVTDLTLNNAAASFEPSAFKFRAQAYW